MKKINKMVQNIQKSETNVKRDREINKDKSIFRRILNEQERMLKKMREML